jgi:predicted ATPase
MVVGVHNRPKTWRKRRIHFHDFMLNVHSHLQVSNFCFDTLLTLGFCENKDGL